MGCHPKDKPEEWAHGNLTRFSKTKILHSGHGNPRHKYREELLESSPAVKDLGLLTDERQIKQYVLVA